MAIKGSIPWNKGLKGCMSEEGKKRMIASKKGKKQSKESIDKRVKSNTGKKRTPEFCEQMRQLNLGRKISEETRKNLSESHKGILVGERNPKWISDRSKLKTGRTHSYDYQYKLWMKLVKNRDNWKCRQGNNECSGRLEAHHIEPWSKSPELRYEVKNGITLCHFHHPRKRSEEVRLAPVFQKMALSPIYG